MQLLQGSLVPFIFVVIFFATSQSDIHLTYSTGTTMVLPVFFPRTNILPNFSRFANKGHSNPVDPDSHSCKFGRYLWLKAKAILLNADRRYLQNAA
jgi:hypothetical protein